MKQNIFRKYLSAKVLPIWTVLLIDVFIIIVSSFLAYSLRYDVRSIFLEYSTAGRTILSAVFVNLIFFRVFRTYSNVLRFSSFVDIMRIFGSLTVSYGVVMLAAYLLDFHFGIKIGSVSVIFIAYVINFALMAFSRIVVKMFFEVINFDDSHSANVFIYGAKEAGVNIAKSLRVNLKNRYRLKGFIADEPELINKIVMGVRIYPLNDKIFDILERKEVKTIIVSPAKMDKMKDSEFTDELLSRNIKLLTAPPLSEWKGQTLNVADLKEIQIEDLLERDTIEVDLKKIASHLEGKRVMVTGAAGSIGSEIMRQVAQFNPYKLILVDQAETPLHDIRLELQDRWRNIDAETIVADVSNANRMRSIFNHFQPQYIFHAAAYKHVPMMEDNVSEAIQVNVLGTKILADLAVEYNADKFVMVSTDKAVNPTNVMGCSKRLAEIYVQSLAKKLQKDSKPSVKFITTRFGNVLGSNGSVIPRFRDQIQRGGPVTVTHPEIIRYFMTIPEACRLVLEAGCMSNGGEIYIFDMGKAVKILDLARRMISLSGRPDIKIEFTGLRHGEKLYEELLNVKETTKPTHHEKIMIATVREYDYNEVKTRIQNLIDLSYTYNQMKIVEAMKEIVPEFISKNSAFEKLDEKK
ncbi:nucleoside-diphosphate sugar epimerase/dehydratase [Bacteroides sp. 519]|uniref:polysaccharide biosynthesis protein n=1 Tax=Bacteroides sp. 519 TaxID=2302937 RepID=UPI0013CFC82D|nr:nucleoside-diphosphate sugar epimerase/dehydratase [Bacteroides sp. 519]NDV60301.1 polysaccharide biosynthesis protein [Bacteroides sp. 519]